MYAVGSPFKEELSSTITSGIVSSLRIKDNQTWIQSDVAISPGSSGGPLLDSNGFVIGISTKGFQISGAPLGLNFIIPIEDAIKDLGVELD